MKRPLSALLLMLCAGTSLVALAREGGVDGTKEPVQSRAPLVVIDRTGGTLLGPAHMHLLVYNDGHVAYVSRSGAPDDNYNLDRQLSPEIVQALHTRLLAAGALELRDQRNEVMDVPLTTVTVLAPKSQVGCNTFSYWIGMNAHEPIEQALRAFVKDHVLSKEPGGRR